MLRIGFVLLVGVLVSLGCSKTQRTEEKVSSSDLPGRVLGRALPAFGELRFGMSLSEFESRFADAISERQEGPLLDRIREELTPELRAQLEEALKQKAPPSRVTLITPPIPVEDSRYPYVARLSLDFVQSRLVRVRMLVDARNQTEALAIEYFWLEHLSRVLRQRFDPEGVRFTPATTAYGLYQWELPERRRVLLQVMPRSAGNPPYVRLLLEDLQRVDSP